MNLRHSLIEQAGDSKAFFISPRGELVSGDSSHIEMIISHPKKFGLTDDYIRKTYEKHHERMGVEGLAREEIILKLIKEGWIHIRRRPGLYWSILINRMTSKIQSYLYDFSTEIVKGIKGVKELNKNAKVRITAVSGSYNKDVTLKQISQHILQEKKEILSDRLLICDIEDLEDY